MTLLHFRIEFNLQTVKRSLDYCLLVVLLKPEGTHLHDILYIGIGDLIAVSGQNGPRDLDALLLV